MAELDVDGRTEIPGDPIVMTVVGQDLGQSGSVELRPPAEHVQAGLEEVVVVPAAHFISHNDTHIVFRMPEGKGDNLQVVAIVGGQESANDVRFSYDPPRVISVRRFDKTVEACEPRERC